MATLAAKRLQQERISFKKEHPFGFYAKFTPAEDGKGQNVFKWICGIKTYDKGPWKGAVLRMQMNFSEEYPGKPPKCIFEKIDGEVLYHPNIYPSGTVCLSILNEEEDWKPVLTVGTILNGIRELLDAPNIKSPAQQEPFQMYEKDKEEYLRKVKDQAEKVKAGQAYAAA